MLYHYLMSDGKLYANSFLSLCCTIVSRRIGNLSLIVSCRCTIQSFHVGQETFRKQFPAAMLAQSSHAGQETIRKQFPAAMLHNRLTPDRKLLRKQFSVAVIRNRSMPDRKPFANSFLSRLYAVVTWRIGNYTQTVSCRYDTQSSHDELETFCKQFPVAMIRNRLTPDSKLYANSFLPLWYAIVTWRTGNLLQTVSCRYDTQSSHAGQ